MPVTEPSLGATGWNTWGHGVTTIVNAVETAPTRLTALEGNLVTNNGADPTGVASSTTAFQNTINAGDVLIPAGTYKVGQITYTGNASRRILALGPVTIIQTDTTGVFSLKGGWDALGTVSSYATVNTNLVTPGESAPGSTDVDVSVLTMSSSTSVVAGDVLKIVADDQTPFTGDVSYRVGEYSLAGKTSSGTTVTLSNILVETYVTSIRLVRAWDVTFRVEGPITFDTDPAIRNSTVWAAVLKLRAAQNCYVGPQVEFRNSLGRAIANNSYATHIDGVKFRNLANRPSKSQYGYGVADNGKLTRMSDCHGENLRHLYTTNSEGASAGSSLYEDFGAAHFAHISNCVAMNCQSQFDTHGDSYGVTFVNCKAVGMYPGASSGGFGFSLRGRANSCVDCYVSDSWRGFGVTGETTLLKDCVARNCNYSALEMGGDSSDGTTYTDIKKLRVVGGEYGTSARSYQTAILGNAPGYTINVELEGVRFTKTGAPGGGSRHIEIQDGVTLTFKDLVFDWERYSIAHGVIGIWVTGANSSITGDGIRGAGGSSSATGFTLIQPNVGVTGAAATPIYATGLRYRHSSVQATMVDSAFTAAQSSWWQKYGTGWWQTLGSAQVGLTAATSAVLPIAGLLDPTITVYLSGTNGAVSLAAIPDTALVPGQVLNVVNNSNGTVTVNTVAITVGAVKRWVFANGAWWAA